MIRTYRPADKEAFADLFLQYYRELDCDDDTDELVNEYILPDFEAELLSIALAEEDGKEVGFVIYQVDGIENEWCFWEDHGDIREIFVLPSHRRHGIGRALLSFAEEALRTHPLYTLPEESAEPFFLACGYEDFGGYCCDLDSKVLEKNG